METSLPHQCQLLMRFPLPEATNAISFLWIHLSRDKGICFKFNKTIWKAPQVMKERLCSMLCRKHVKFQLIDINTPVLHFSLVKYRNIPAHKRCYTTLDI